VVPWEPLLEELRSAVAPTLAVRPEPDVPPGSVALLAGSFDPITVGHAAMAEAVREDTELVVLVYSVRTLPKEGEPGAPLLSEPERLAWLERFRQGRARVAIGVSSHGLLADQVLAATERFPGAALSLVVGSDKLLQLLDPNWYEDVDATLARLFERARILYTTRAGEGRAIEDALAALDERWRSRIEPLAVPPGIAAVASRHVRDGLRRGEDVASLVPEEVRPLLAQLSRAPG